MANEHIGRLVQVGIASEVTAGTGVNAEAWLKKVTGKLNVEVEKVDNESAKGTIGSRTDTVTTKKMTRMPIQGIAHTVDLGYLLKAAFGQATLTVPCTLSGISGGTPAVGDSVSVGSPAMTGTIKYIAESKYHVEVLTGAFTASSNTATLTDGVWTATIGGIDNAIFSHVFERPETNNHQSFSLYAYDPVDPQKATYGVLDSFEMEMGQGRLVEVAGEFVGQKIEDDATGVTPSYNDSQFNFVSRQATIKFGAAITNLDGASAEDVLRFKLALAKNVADFQRLGSDEPTSIHNQNWDLTGDFDMIFNSITERDLVLDDTVKAVRVLIDATDFTIGSAGSPQLLIDISEAGFTEFSESDANNELRTQTIGFRQNETSDAGTSKIVVAVLTNTKTTAY